jgi:hypothetical protein
MTCARDSRRFRGSAIALRGRCRQQRRDPQGRAPARRAGRGFLQRLTFDSQQPAARAAARRSRSAQPPRRSRPAANGSNARPTRPFRPPLHPQHARRPQLQPWLSARAALPIGAAVLHHRWPDPRTTVVKRGVRVELRRLAAQAGVRRRFAPHQLRHAHALELAREGVPVEHHPASGRPREPRHDVDLPAGNRPRGDHRHRPHPPGADDVRQRRAAALIEEPDIASGSTRSRSILANRAPGKPSARASGSSRAGVFKSAGTTLASTRRDRRVSRLHEARLLITPRCHARAL